MKGVKVAKQRNSEIQIPSKNDVIRVITAAEGKWKVIIILLATTTLRAGQLRALQWKNLDLAQGVLRVTQAVKKKKGSGSPKTSNGYRSLPISYKLGNLFSDLPRASQFIFPGQYGGCIGYESLWEGVNRCIRKAGVPWPVRLHVFRHHAASVLISNNWDLKRIQKMMGHANIQMTVDRYGHLIESLDAHGYGAAMIARLIPDTKNTGPTTKI